MTTEFVPSDIALLDLLRKHPTLTVAQLAQAMEVTATAVRQRLTRLMAQGYIERTVSREGRGRPSHHYRLTSEGRRKTGANFEDLAIVLWQEVREIRDPDVRRGLVQRISKRMAQMYADQVEGRSLEEKMESLATLFGRREIPFEVDQSGELPVLTALACPYPDLAEQDRSVCAMERNLFAEVLGENIKLNKCRLDGEACCTFEVSAQATS